MATKLVFERRAELTRHCREGKTCLSGRVTPGEFERSLSGEAFGIGGVGFAQSVRRSDTRDLIHPTERTAGE